jgi:cadmium resistance protein CadD (predicted permease)
MNKTVKNYILKFGNVVFLYAVVLFLSVRLMHGLNESPWRFVAALLPMIPIGICLRIFLQIFNELDELQKRIQLHALAFSFGTVGLLTFSYGLLQNAGNMPLVSLVAVLPIMTVLWGVGYIIASWRYE